MKNSSSPNETVYNAGIVFGRFIPIVYNVLNIFFSLNTD